MRRHSRLLRGLAVGAIAAAVAVTSCTPTDPGDGGTIGATRARTQPDTMPLAATSGTPRIELVRDGSVIATYTSFGSAFQRTHAYNNRRPGDVFKVYPAVYSGLGQFPYVGPLPDNDADAAAGVFQAPTDLTIRGVTVDGRRPVLQLRDAEDYNNYRHGLLEIDGANGLVWENIDVDGTGGSGVDRSGIYVLNSRNVTIRNSRIHGFDESDNNGVFGAGGNAGTLWLDNVRLFDNGGWDGPSHNVYINSSDVDPNFTAKITNSISTRATVGHLFKSRAQVTIAEGNLFEGTDSHPGWECAESFGLDVPEGGRLTAANNVFVKAKPGACANGVALRYAAEAFTNDRTHSVSITNNTFIASSTVWDDSGHRNVPLGFLYPPIVPTAPGSPITDVTVSSNRFEGFDASGEPAASAYRGTNFVDVPAS